MVHGCGGEGKKIIGRLGIGHSFDVGFDAQHIRVSVAAGISVRARAEGEIWQGAPVLQVMAAGKGGGQTLNVGRLGIDI